jgi:hypothetical protein
MTDRGGGLTLNETLIDGPYFEDLHHGQRFDDSRGLTLNVAKVHHDQTVGAADTPGADVIDWRFVALLA